MANTKQQLEGKKMVQLKLQMYYPELLRVWFLGGGGCFLF